MKKSLHTCSFDECPMPLYTLKLTFENPIDCNFVTVNLAQSRGTIGSASPWHVSIGVTNLFSAEANWAGKLAWRGSQVLRAITPANLCEEIRAVYRAVAPPWEKPPMNIRSVGMPALISCSTRFKTEYFLKN